MTYFLRQVVQHSFCDVLLKHDEKLHTTIFHGSIKIYLFVGRFRRVVKIQNSIRNLIGSNCFSSGFCVEGSEEGRVGREGEVGVGPLFSVDVRVLGFAVRFVQVDGSMRSNLQERHLFIQIRMFDSLVHEPTTSCASLQRSTVASSLVG